MLLFVIFGLAWTVSAVSLFPLLIFSTLPFFLYGLTIYIQFCFPRGFVPSLSSVYPLHVFELNGALCSRFINISFYKNWWRHGKLQTKINFLGLHPRVCPSLGLQAGSGLLVLFFFIVFFFFAWHIKNILVLRTARCFVNYGIIIIKKQRWISSSFAHWYQNVKIFLSLKRYNNIVQFECMF